MSVSDAWEHHATGWIAWTRSSTLDRFESDTWPELRAVLPAPTPGERVVEIGCGEGRVARALVRLGHRVIGVERSPTLVAATHANEPAFPVVRADAAALPIAASSVSLTVACMSLQDIDDLDGAVAEVARILRPGGHLCVAMVHPFASAEDVGTQDDESAVISRPYLEARRYEDAVERDDASFTFVSIHRPLSTYMAAFASAGFVLTELRERGSRVIPFLLVLALQKRG